MRFTIIPLILIVLTVSFSAYNFKPKLPYPPYFRIYENNKFGYIDSNGTIAIEPKFRNAMSFSEDLAAVRVAGEYGYIDYSGAFVIQPEFDFAHSFKEGLALVYKGGKPYFINKKGEKPFNVDFAGMQDFEFGLAIVITETRKFGMINKKGKLVVDTVFSNMSRDVNGMTIVEGLNHRTHVAPSSGLKIKLETGIIDSTGKFIVPFGKYSFIQYSSNGYFKVDFKEFDKNGKEKKRFGGFVDFNGKLLLFIEEGNYIWLEGDLSCGLASLNLYAKKADNQPSYHDNYEGYIDLNGNIVIDNPNYNFVEDFAFNRAFVRNKNHKYFLIDKSGQKVVSDSFSQIVGDGFEEGVAFVQKQGKYGMIDTNGHFLIPPKYESIHHAGLCNGYFFHSIKKEKELDEPKKLYGITDKNGKLVLDPVMDYVDPNGFNKGLLFCIIDERQAYVNTKGKIVWHEPKNPDSQPVNLNIDHMQRGYFYAYSAPEKYGSRGYAVSENMPKKITGSNRFPDNQLSLSVHLDKPDTFDGSFNGCSVFISNTTDDSIIFNAQDRRLYMKTQAKNNNGEWKDIEYLPSSWCGNSYHILYLQSNEYWKLTMPVYEGSITTKLRIELKHINPNDTAKYNHKKEEIILYSNEFEGSVNPAQFWRKKEYYSMGLMDPYFD